MKEIKDLSDERIIELPSKPCRGKECWQMVSLHQTKKASRKSENHHNLLHIHSLPKLHLSIQKGLQGPPAVHPCSGRTLRFERWLTASWEPSLPSARRDPIVVAMVKFYIYTLEIMKPMSPGLQKDICAMCFFLVYKVAKLNELNF